MRVVASSVRFLAGEVAVVARPEVASVLVADGSEPRGVVVVPFPGWRGGRERNVGRAEEEEDAGGGRVSRGASGVRARRGVSRGARNASRGAYRGADARTERGRGGGGRRFGASAAIATRRALDGPSIAAGPRTRGGTSRGPASRERGVRGGRGGIRGGGRAPGAWERGEGCETAHRDRRRRRRWRSETRARAVTSGGDATRAESHEATVVTFCPEARTRTRLAKMMNEGCFHQQSTLVARTCVPSGG